MSFWDLTALQQTPEWSVAGEAEAGIQPVLYQGEPYRGRPTRAFAYLGVPKWAPPARPEEIEGTEASGVPGMVLVHGGGGTAFREWVAIWNARGYAAIAMDLSGRGAGRQPLPDGGPDQGDEPSAKFGDPAAGWADHWVYHSVANVLRAHSLLRSVPGVDPRRIGITGISWGGYLTCIVAGVDQRFACAIPVYGCGFLQHNSVWLDRGSFAAMSEASRRAWHDRCDPAQYAGAATMPMLFVSGTNDFAYPLDSYQRTYSLVRRPLSLAVRVRLAHGHPQGWAPPEIARFAEHLFRDGPPLPTVGAMTRRGEMVSASYRSELPLAAAHLAYTRDRGPWPERFWHVVDAGVSEETVGARLPDGVTAYFLNVTDTAAGYASAPHQEAGNEV
jgi:dienelactone hydrolase